MGGAAVTGGRADADVAGLPDRGGEGAAVTDGGGDGIALAVAVVMDVDDAAVVTVATADVG